MKLLKVLGVLSAVLGLVLLINALALIGDPRATNPTMSIFSSTYIIIFGIMTYISAANWALKQDKKILFISTILLFLVAQLAASSIANQLMYCGIEGSCEAASSVPTIILSAFCIIGDIILLKRILGNMSSRMTLTIGWIMACAPLIGVWISL